MDETRKKARERGQKLKRLGLQRDLATAVQKLARL